MKSRFLLFSLVLVSFSTYSQEPADALRYSWLTPQGTARSMATGNALTALGGDITSTFTNPAGLGLFKTGELVLTPGFGFDNNKSAYLGGTDKANKSSFMFGSTGLILPINNDYTGRKWKNWTFGIAVNRTADFNSRFALEGNNNQSSYSEKYLEELINNNVTDPNDAANNFPYGASLAFNTFLIDTVSGSGGTVEGYRSLATPQTGVRQIQDITTSGGMTDLGLAISGNLGDKFYVGGAIAWSYLNFERNSTYREEDATGNATNDFNYFTTEEYLKTEARGINLKFGVIFKPVDFLRLGLSIHSPTWYDMSDSYATTIRTDLEGYAGAGEKFQSSRDFNNGQNGFFEYGLNNPWRVQFGFAYVFREDRDITRQRGFLTADIEYVDYRSNQFTSPDIVNNSASYFGDLNSVVDDIYRGTLNFRVGGEMKFNTIMARLGFAYFGNPYEDADFKVSRMNLSGGLGYRNKGKFIDLTYVHQLYQDGYYPYRLDNGFFAPSTIKSGLGTILVTIGFKF
jgi:hypothetical protein